MGKQFFQSQIAGQNFHLDNSSIEVHVVVKQLGNSEEFKVV